MEYLTQGWLSSRNFIGQRDSDLCLWGKEITEWKKWKSIYILRQNGKTSFKMKRGENGRKRASLWCLRWVTFRYSVTTPWPKTFPRKRFIWACIPERVCSSSRTRKQVARPGSLVVTFRPHIGSKENQPELGQDCELSKVASSDRYPPARSHLLNSV